MMDEKEIERRLKEWSNEMVNKFDSLTIRYEYSNSLCCYRVSYTTIHNKEQATKFYKFLIEFEKKMEKDYPYDAPLFTDDNRLFKLSQKAIVIKRKS